MIVVVLILILTATVGGGIYYYNTYEDIQQPAVYNKAQIYDEYLKKSVINAEEVYKVFSKYFEEVVVSEKLNQVIKNNNIMQILNLKFKTANLKGRKSKVYSFIIKNTLSLLNKTGLQNKDLSKLVKDYTNANKIKFKVRESEKSITIKIAKRPNKFNLNEKVKNYISPNSNAIDVEQNPFNTIESLGYLNNNEMFIYITSTISPVSHGDMEYLNNIISKLPEIKANILKSLIEKIDNIPSIN